MRTKKSKRKSLYQVTFDLEYKELIISVIADIDINSPCAMISEVLDELKNEQTLGLLTGIKAIDKEDVDFYLGTHPQTNMPIILITCTRPEGSSGKWYERDPIADGDVKVSNLQFHSIILE